MGAFRSLLFLLGFFLGGGSAFSADLPLKSGDRIVFLGDSIADANRWTHYLSSYLILRNPGLTLHLQTEGRGGSTIPEATDQGRYARRVAPYRPTYVFSMFGHNGRAKSEEWGAYLGDLCRNYISVRSGAIPILIGPHPRNDSSGKPILGEYENRLSAVASRGGWRSAPIWHELLPAWTRNAVAANPINLGYVDGDTVHPGAAGHIAIAYSVVKLLGFGADVSSADIDARNLGVISRSGCEISNLKANADGGIDFTRLDSRLPWAIDEEGRSAAQSFLPEIAGWQKYMLKVSGLQPGSYELSIGGVPVVTKPAGEWEAGVNMSDFTAGPVHTQCQEVLSKIRDMHGIDRKTLLALGPPNRGVVRYKSNADTGYIKMGLRGKDLITYLQPALTELSDSDALIRQAAQPIPRLYSLRRTEGDTASSLPPGIPNPIWGGWSPLERKNPVFPGGWPTAVSAGYYFVNSDHPAATDDGNIFGYPAKPRVTIPSALNAGSVVVLVNCRSNVSLTARGTESNPVWIVGDGAGNFQPKAVGTFLNVTNSSYLMVDGLNFDGTGCPANIATVAFSIRDGSNHVCIRNCSVRNMPAPPYNPTRFQNGGAGAWYSALTNISPSKANVNDVVFYQVKIKDNCGGQSLDYESGRHCLLASGDSRGVYRVENVWVLNCTFENNSEDGIQLGQTSINADQTLCRKFYIGGNTISKNGENAIDLKACDKIVVSGNTFNGYSSTKYRAGAVSGSDGSACVINDDGKGPLESWWLCNNIFDCHVAFRNQAAEGRHYLVGNCIHHLNREDGDKAPLTSGSASGVAYWHSGGASVHLVNNTIYRVHGGIYLNNVAEAEVRGNVVSDLVEHTVGWPVNINKFAAADLGDNLYFDPDGPVREDANALNSSDLLNSNPKLINPEAGNLSPEGTSPLVGKVSARKVYETFAANYGMPVASVLVDWKGNARPAPRWAAGALEPEGNSEEVPKSEGVAPSKVKGLRISK